MAGLLDNDVTVQKTYETIHSLINNHCDFDNWNIIHVLTYVATHYLII